MRAVVCAAVVAGLTVMASNGAPVAAQEAKSAPTAKAASGKDSPAAERTRTKLLKAKVTVALTDYPLREAFKEFAAQVEGKAERPVMWTYAATVVPADKRVTYKCTDKPLDEALDELFQAHGLGYVVVSQDDQPKDGWVRVTKGDERGYAKDEGGEAETNATARLGIAKDLVDKGKAADAKAVLTLVVSKYPNTKAAAEAKALLEKLNK